MAFTLHKEDQFTFLDEGKGPVLLMLHGLFGALSNWEHVINHFSSRYRLIIPMLPIYDMPIRSASIDGLVDYLEKFIDYKNLQGATLLGNSLGGHVGLVYTLKNPEKVSRLVLTGSSGLFESAMGGSFPKRGNLDYIRERVGYTFYDPAVATDELVSEIFQTTQNITKCMCIVSIAKSAQRHNLAKDLHKLALPVLLVWGLNDTITPAHVGHEFNRLIQNSTLRFIDKCCHAPMMEVPDRFNIILDKFLADTNAA